MRKILIIVLIIALLAGFGILVTSGVTIGQLELPAVEKIVSDNKNLDTKIAELDNEIKTKYTGAQSELESSVTKLKKSKQKYQETINYSTEDEIRAANQMEKYKIDFIWTKIGMYATKNNVIVKMDVSAGTVADLYNISFTATGEYLDISEFIYAIENDSKLGFKIEEFTMSPYSDDTLQSTFAVKNVAIDKDSLTVNGEIVNNNINNNSNITNNTNDTTNTQPDTTNTVNTNDNKQTNGGSQETVIQ